MPCVNNFSFLLKQWIQECRIGISAILLLSMYEKKYFNINIRNDVILCGVDLIIQGQQISGGDLGQQAEFWKRKRIISLCLLKCFYQFPSCFWGNGEFSWLWKEALAIGRRHMANIFAMETRGPGEFTSPFWASVPRLQKEGIGLNNIQDTF